jgi:hypothetical protein
VKEHKNLVTPYRLPHGHIEPLYKWRQPYYVQLGRTGPPQERERRSMHNEQLLTRCYGGGFGSSVTFKAGPSERLRVAVLF